MVHQRPDRLAVVFDDERVVANAGLMLAVTLGQRLGIEALVDEIVDLGDRPGAARPGRKVLSFAHAMLLGADSIDDCDVLRAGRTEAVLGHHAMAPSTLGTFLRSFSFGHVRQLDQVLATALARAWSAGAGPGSERLVIDIDSFVGEVHGDAKQGAGYGYTGQRGYHPLIASRADTAEVLHVRQRGGQANTQRGALRFVGELIPRVRRAGAAGEIVVRADSGFWNKKVCAYLTRQGCEFSIGVTMRASVQALIAQIPDPDWEPVADYPDTGVCELAETTLGEHRLIIRRVHLHAQEAQGELFTYWRYHAFITNRTEAIHLVDSEHRQHAVVEQVIRDLKDQALAHFPSGHYSANSAWTVIACLAHNLARWTLLLGVTDPTPRTAATTRRRLFALPGRITRTARQSTMHLPARWPWQASFIEALTRIRALPHRRLTHRPTPRPTDPRPGCSATPRDPENGSAETAGPAINLNTQAEPLANTPPGSGQPPSPLNARDPHENGGSRLRLARSSRGILLVSGDRDLLEADVADIEVLTPRALIDRLE